MGETTFTIHFEPNGKGGQFVTVPEIGAHLEIDGERLEDAQSAALAAITEHLEAERKRRPRRHEGQAKAS